MTAPALIPSRLAAALAACGLLLAPAIAEARSKRSGPPRIVAATTLDADRDGRVDGLSVRYSTAVRNRPQRAGKFPFAVDGYRVRAVKRARGKTLTIVLEERASLDTASRPGVTYQRPRGRRGRRFAVVGRDRARRQAFNGAFKATRDGVAPRLLSARTADADADGLLDGLVARFSEPVRPGGSASFAVAGAGVRSLSAAGGDEIGVGIAGPGLATDARPQLAYTGADEPVRDASGNAAAPGSIAPSDAAPPVLVSAATADASGEPGRIDRLALTFSEPVATSPDSLHPFSVEGYRASAAGAAAGPSLALDLVEGPAPDTGARPGVRYARSAAGSVRDAAGNEAADRGVEAFDGAAPRILSATTLDEDGDGRLDALRFAYSEAVVHEAEAGGGSFAASLEIATARAAVGDTIDLGLVEAAAPNSGSRPSATYAPDGTNDVADRSGNAAPYATILQAADGARPVMTSAETADSDADNRIDTINVTFSEAIEHAEDAAEPFALSASDYSISSVGDASGASLAVGLVETAAPDTGSAPTLSYASAGGAPIRDGAGLEPAERAYAGLTRDAVGPALIEAITADADFDGRLDRIELRYSEDVTGSTATAPFAVAGRSISGVSYASERVRLAIDEGGPDTASTPSVSYSPGDLADIPEGAGDTSQSVPSFSSQATTDRAAPIVTEATTADADSNGKLDGIVARFSEPVAHPVDAAAPFALEASGRTVRAVSAANSNLLTVTVSEAASPDGGVKPDLSVVAPASGERVRDLAPEPNDARAMTFTATADGVRPVLVAAQMGESVSGLCQRTPAVDGHVDCVRATWSETVSHEADSDGSYPLSVDSGYAVGASGIAAASGSDSIDVPLQPKSAFDRDKAATVAYDDAIASPVRDLAGNVSLPGGKLAARACADTGNEDNDARDAGNPALTANSPSPQRKCAFDDDWFRITTGSAGIIKLVLRPGAALASEVAIVAPDGGTVGASAPNSSGENDTVEATGLATNQDYWVRVTAPDTQEDAYCVAIAITAADEPTCGPNVGEVIFTEVGIDADKFVELKNVSDYAIDLSQFELRHGTGTPCRPAPPAGSQPTVGPNQYVVITPTGAGGTFSCGTLGELVPAGERLEIRAGFQIDSVDLGGVMTSPLAAQHSLGVKPAAENGSLNDDVAGNWCRTFAADSRGRAGDGCDEYRINEVLFNPVPTGSDGVDGRAFLEIAGNLPTAPNSKLLGGWVVRGVDGGTGGGTPDFVLPAAASPSAQGLYVIADGVNGDPTRTNVSPADAIWPELDASAGPRGLQLLFPNPPGGRPCGSAAADAFGWSTTGTAFTQLADAMRGCRIVEGQEYVVPTQGRSAARDNLSNESDTTYNPANDTDRNSPDFCVQATPNPGALNVRPDCS